jgi:uncharacterized damage-inducible protein DinB
VADPEIETFRRRLLLELDRLVAALSDLTVDGANWRPIDRANSVLVLATHTFGAAEDHVLRQLCGQQIDRSRPAEFAATGDPRGFAAQAEATKRRIADALDVLDPKRLSEARDTPWGPRTGRDTLVHAIAHAAEHAGQAELTRDLAKERGERAASA